MMDVTHRKRFEQEVERGRQIAEDANKAKDQFLSILSHELRTPLTPVLTTVELLEMDPALAPAMRHDLETIRRNVLLEARLIDDLLDLTRIARGKLDLRLQTADAHQLLRHALDACAQEISEKRLRVVLNLHATQSLVRADPVRLQQVFWNLIQNAAKFTPPSGSLTLKTRNSDEAKAASSESSPPPSSLQPLASSAALVIEIIDTGIGIEPDVMDRIFGLFEQGDASLTRRFGGLGLGLSISKSLIEMHGGQLTAASTGKDQGATFTVVLPLAQSAAAPAPAVSKSGGLRILLVEDHPDTSLALLRLLTGLGHEVRTAATVASALQVAQAESFDLLISDLGLPDGTGLDVLRGMGDRRPAKAIALTGFGRDEDIHRTRECGFTHHLIKPVDLPTLQKAIEQAMRSGG